MTNSLPRLGYAQAQQAKLYRRVTRGDAHVCPSCDRAGMHRLGCPNYPTQNPQVRVL